MATDKKHIAVYLDPAVEQALIAFCHQKGLISKKGTMFSAGVNAALAQFFGVVDTTTGNIPATTGNIPATTGNIPATTTGNIPATTTGNIPATTTGNISVESLAVGVLPGKLQA